MTSTKTIAFDLGVTLSTDYSRRNETNMRGAFYLSDVNYVKEEIVLAHNQSFTITSIGTFAFLATDGDTISLAITKGANTVTVALKQVTLLTDAINQIVVSNTASAGPTIRVRVIYS